MSLWYFVLGPTGFMARPNNEPFDQGLLCQQFGPFFTVRSLKFGFNVIKYLVSEVPIIMYSDILNRATIFPFACAKTKG